MGGFESADEILEFAIAREVEAYELYMYMVERVENPVLKDVIVEFAEEELEHKTKLELEVLKKGLVVMEDWKPADFNVFENRLDGKDTLDMDYEELLSFAIKKEDISFRLYADLAGVVRDKAMKDVLLALAEEEVKHKLRFEEEYEAILKDE